MDVDITLEGHVAHIRDKITGENEDVSLGFTPVDFAQTCWGIIFWNKSRVKTLGYCLDDIDEEGEDVSVDVDKNEVRVQCGDKAWVFDRWDNAVRECYRRDAVREL